MNFDQHIRWTYKQVYMVWEFIFIYCGLFVLILVVFFVLFLLSLRFGQISPLAFFRWFLPRPQRGMMSLVTVFPVITAFHSCCLLHHVFCPSKSLAGLGRIWNHYLLTFLSEVAVKSPEEGQRWNLAGT